MGRELPHNKVKLVIPVLYSDEIILSMANERLKALFGETDYESAVLPFTYTEYYREEMGSPIKRIFYSFKNLIKIPDLVPIKKTTNGVEIMLEREGKRKINLDPGYMELGKFVLATTKDQQHRLYMGEGIYEEITLFFRGREWKHWEWTYPDYRSTEYREILLKIRSLYRNQIKEH